VRGVGGREHLAAALRARGAQVEYLEAYRRAVPILDPLPVRRALEQQRLRAIVAASAEGVRNLVTMVGPSWRRRCIACRYSCTTRASRSRRAARVRAGAAGACGGRRTRPSAARCLRPE